MKYFCVSSDPDVLSGLRLAGVGGVLASGAKDTAEAVARARADKDVAVLLITEDSYALVRETIDELKLSGHRPLVNVIPDSGGPKRPADYITRLINEAIGIKI